MRFVIYLPFLLSAAAIPLVRRGQRRMAPQVAAWSITVAMLALAATTVGALGLLAWPLAARVPIVAELGRWRAGAVGHGVPVPLWVSLLAAVALAVLAWRVIVLLDALVRQVVDAERIHSDFKKAGAADLVVIADPTPSAHAIPRAFMARGRIVVTTGLLNVLDDDERVAVLAHEQSHLRHAHGAFVAAADLSAALNPLLGQARQSVHYAVERWADEDAATRTDRNTAASALAAAAIARLDRLYRGTFVAAGALHMGTVDLSERVAALLQDTPAQRRSLVSWLLAVVTFGAALAVVWGMHDTERLFEALRRV